MRHFGHPIYILPEGEDENSPGRGPRHTVFVCWGGGRSEAQSWVPSPNRLNRPVGPVRHSNSLTKRIGDLP